MKTQARGKASLAVVALACWIMPAAAVAAGAGAVAQTDKQTILRMQKYINSITTMKGSFTQDGPQKNNASTFHFSSGTFALHRPGRMRFDYVKPTPSAVIADGVWVVIQNNKRGLFERYPLNATPARFLLQANLNILKSAKVEDLRVAGKKISFWLRPKDQSIGGKIKLIFRKKPLALEGWTIIDPQGLTTQVRLKNVRRGLSLDPALFFIKDKKTFKKRRGR